MSFKIETPKLYINTANPGTRSILMLMKALDIQNIDLVHLNLGNLEHLADWFKKINPQHTVPTFVESNGLVIWDSHAILIYLFEKYALNDTLYPDDSGVKALINQRLFFDTEKLFGSIKTICKPLAMKQRNCILESDIADVLENYSFMENFLENNEWMVGDNVTLADISLIPSVMTLDFLVPIDKTKFSKLNDWLTRAKALPYYEQNTEGFNNFVSIISPLLG